MRRFWGFGELFAWIEIWPTEGFEYMNKKK